MADVTLLGVDYQDVPSVMLPKTGGGTAPFHDTTIATATAPDVSNGKTFFGANGLEVGTGSGGGSYTIPMGGIRPDAELVKTWTYDKLVVTDEKVTIPAYSTTNVALVASADIDTYVVNHANYAYIVVERILSIPIYKASYTGGAGKEEYVFSAISYELVYAPSNYYATLDGSKAYATANPAFATHGQYSRFIRWSNATTLALYTSAAYGVGHTYNTPTIVANGTMTIKSPTFQIRGHATYLPEALYSQVDDIRNQYVIELWRVPKDPAKVNGYDIYSCVDSIVNDIKNNNFKLR